MLEPVRLEIGNALAEALGEAGLSGELQLKGNRVFFSRTDARIDLPLGSLPTRWPNCVATIREREIASLTERVQVALGAPKVPTWTPLFSFCVVMMALAASCVVYSARTERTPERALRAAAVAPISPQVPAAAPTVALRMSRCRDTRNRVLRGGTIYAGEAEGWEVELAFLQATDAPSLRSSAIAKRLLSDSSADSVNLLWSELPAELTSIATPLAIRERVDGGVREIRLRLPKALAQTYFNEHTRRLWTRFADVLAHTAEVRGGALFAHCQDDPANAIGAWFFGTTPQHTQAALLYYMAYAGESPALDLLPLNQGDSPSALDVLLQRTPKTSARELATWVAADAGTVSADTAGTSLSFPFVDANRATRGALRIARKQRLLRSSGDLAAPAAATQ